MRDINEVLALQDINQKIYYLKKGRKTELPDAVKLYNDWNPNRHEIITDEEKYPKIKVTLKPEKKYTDPTTGKEHTEPEQKKLVDPNRIALPIEQDIVNIQTAFTVGTEPLLDCKPEQSEEGLLTALKQVFKKNKIKYQNKRAVRSWLAEQERHPLPGGQRQGGQRSHRAIHPVPEETGRHHHHPVPPPLRGIRGVAHQRAASPGSLAQEELYDVINGRHDD